MTYSGKVHGGVVVLQKGVQLPEGADVEVHVRTAASPPDPRGRSIWQKLAELGRAVESRETEMPHDMALNHDHYLHGAPKRDQ